jgi:two-component system alkaline phosphatase synthesis response regulator PhoP
MAMAVRDRLNHAGYLAEVAKDGCLALRVISQGKFDLVILDVSLPGLNGNEICREMRKVGDSTPVIMLTANNQEENKVESLRFADDYMVKPPGMRELVARVEVQVRRLRKIELETYRFDDIEVDFSKHEILRRGVSVKPTYTEFLLMTAFIERRNRVLTREELLNAVKASEDITDRSIDYHISHLRAKIEPEGDFTYIKTVRNVGYRFDEPNQKLTNPAWLARLRYS